MDRKTVIHVSQTLGHKAACGIGIIGDLIAQSLRKSEKFDFKIIYADAPGPVQEAITEDTVAIIYHYAIGTTPWVNGNHLLTRFPDIIHIKTHHDMTQHLIDTFTPEQHGGFSYLIADDPTLTPNDHVFTTQRLIPPYTPRTSYTSDIPIIGFQGFGPVHKGIPRIAHKVQEEFDEAVIRLHIPFGFYGDPHGHDARRRVREVKDIIKKPKIKIESSHDLKTPQEIIDLLATNTVNCYFYDFLPGCGLASSPDFALAAKRPIAITKSHQFRNLWNLSPTILIEQSSLREIIANGLVPLEPLYEAYSEQRVIKDYEQIIERLIHERSI